MSDKKSLKDSKSQKSLLTPEERERLRQSTLSAWEKFGEKSATAASPSVSKTLLEQGETLIYLPREKAHIPLKTVTPGQMISWVAQLCPSIDVTQLDLTNLTIKERLFELVIQTLQRFCLTIPENVRMEAVNNSNK